MQRRFASPDSTAFPPSNFSYHVTATISATSVTLYVVHRTAVCCILLLGTDFGTRACFRPRFGCESENVCRTEEHSPIQPPLHPGFVPPGDIRHVRTDGSATAAALLCLGCRGCRVAVVTVFLSHHRLLDCPSLIKLCSSTSFASFASTKTNRLNNTTMHSLHALSYPSECLGKLTPILARVYSGFR